MTTFITKSHVIASIMATKKKYFNEEFVTLKETNYITQQLQNAFDEDDLNTIITNDFDSNNIIFQNVYLPKKSIPELEYFYHNIPSLEVLSILWNKNYILNLLLEFYKAELSQVEIQKPSILTRKK